MSLEELELLIEQVEGQGLKEAVLKVHKTFPPKGARVLTEMGYGRILSVSQRSYNYEIVASFAVADLKAFVQKCRKSMERGP